jgi:carnitine O-acetyltransferase
VDDGYGLSYAIDDNNLRWCITTKNGDAQQFADALVAAAEELRGMMDRVKAAGSGAEKAKL